MYTVYTMYTVLHPAKFKSNVLRFFVETCMSHACHFGAILVDKDGFRISFL